MKQPISGILLIDKPTGWTSFDVVNKARGIIARNFELKPKQIKVGHAGTLDPMATGLLVLLIGDATKQAMYLSAEDKVYDGEMTFGASSNTDDAEGDIVSNKVGDTPVDTQLIEAFKQFCGPISQLPPDFSAKKIDGKRAYATARMGEKPKLEHKEVIVHSLDLIEYSWPKATFSAHVSKGTYIRSLARDVGAKLRVGGYLSKLRRTSAGNFKLDDAITMDGLDFATIEHNILSTYMIEQENSSSLEK